MQEKMIELQLLKNLAEIGESASVLSHEIKTPITGLRHALSAVGDKLGVEHGVLIDEFVGATGGADAGGGQRVLDGDGDACQWAEGRARCASGVDGMRLGAGSIGSEGDDGVDLPVESLDSVEMGVEQLGGANRFRFEGVDDGGQ